MDLPFAGQGIPLKGVGPEHIREGAIRTEHILNGTIQLADLAAALQAFLVPTGSIIMWGGSAAPSEWFLCDGTAKSRTTEADLFAVYGTTFGAGDGSTTFNLPDLRQRFPLGKAASGTGVNLGSTGGAVDHVHPLDSASSHAKIMTLVTGPPHIRILRKSVTSWNETHDVSATSGATGSTASTFGAELGGDSDIANPPFQVVNFICKR